MQVDITAVGRIELLRADGSLVSKHNGVEEAIESAIDHGAGEYRIRYPERRVKIYGTIAPGGGDTTAPTIPLNVAEVTHSATTATISWDASTDDVGVSGYQVFKDGLPVDTTADLSYQFTGLTPSTSYSFTVAAYDAAGNYSGESSAVVIVTSANAAPSWSVGQQELTTYTAYYLDLTSVCSDADGNPPTFSVVTGTLPSGVTFDSVAKTVAGTPTAVGSGAVTFRASDGITTTDQAITFNVLNADATAPAEPANLAVAVASSSQLNLTWDISADTAGTNERSTGTATYNVYRSTDGVNYSLRQPVTAPTHAYNDTELSASTLYYYRVSAVDAAGNASAQCAPQSATTSAGAAPLFFDDFNYVVDTNPANAAANGAAFNNAGWNGSPKGINLPNQNNPVGYLYTELVSNIPGYSGAAPSPTSQRALCMHSLAGTNASQTDFYIGRASTTDPNYIPANVWFQFWIYPCRAGSQMSGFHSREKFIYPSLIAGTNTNHPWWLVELTINPYPTAQQSWAGTSGNTDLLLGDLVPVPTDPNLAFGLGQTSAAQYIAVNRWTLVKIHIDTSQAQTVYEAWMRPLGGAWTKVAEWIGGVTPGLDWPRTVAQRTGHYSFAMPTTMPGPGSATPTYDAWIYMQDFAMASSEATLPTY